MSVAGGRVTDGSSSKLCFHILVYGIGDVKIPGKAVTYSNVRASYAVTMVRSFFIPNSI